MSLDVELTSSSSAHGTDHGAHGTGLYKQELHRGFSATMDLAFCFTAVSILSSVSLLLGYGLAAGGPAVMIWGWIVGSVFTCLTALSMAEICSAHPNVGSVYNWAGTLAPEKWAPLSSFVTGWANFIGNAAGDAAFGAAFGAFATAGYNMSVSADKQLSDSVSIGVGIAACVTWALMNVMRVDQQGWVNLFATGWQITATLVIIIALCAQTAGDMQPASFVFTKYNDSTGFNSVPYVVLIGLLTTLYSIAGYEAGAHMAEETKGATLAAPNSIIYTVVMVSSCGFALIVTFLFSLPDLDAVLSAENATIFIFFSQSRYLGQALTALLAVNTFFAGISSMTVTSRIAYAMARDQAFPGSDFMVHINRRTKTPLRLIGFVLVVDVLLLLMGLGSSLAFAAVTSVTTIGYQVSYAIPILLRVTYARKRFQAAEFSLGRYAVPIGWLAGVWLAATSVIFVLPTASPVTIQNMNYASVVVAGFAVIGAIYWIVWARVHFKGPARSEHDGSHALARAKVSSDCVERLYGLQSVDLDCDEQ